MDAIMMMIIIISNSNSTGNNNNNNNNKRIVTEEQSIFGQFGSLIHGRKIPEDNFHEDDTAVDQK